MDKRRIKIYFTDEKYHIVFPRPFVWNKNVKTNRLKGNLYIIKPIIIYK